jgi:3-oxoacyl-[acyl-carrier protein] reductase
VDRFVGRVAVVTGGSRGIGAATARRLGAEGAAVVVAARDEQASRDVVQEITDKGGIASAVTCDVTDEDAVDALVERVVDRHGRLDILVNNAGITRDNLLFKMPLSEWEAVLSTNLTGMFLCSRAAQRHMVAVRYGKIVNLGSRSALGARGQANYAAAKAGIQGFTATLAVELGPFGINVNAVAPGYVATDMTAATARRVGVTPEEHQQQVAGRTPLGRVGQPAEIAAVVAFLASEDAAYVSGQTLFVNGGAR